MTVRAKFTLYSITDFGGTVRTLKFNAQYDTSIPEDQRFAMATPNGSFETYCDNPSAIEQFQIGKAYYFDITPAGV